MITVADQLQVWYSDVVVPTTSPNTQLAYRDCLDRYLLPSLGRIPLNELRAPAVRSLLAGMSREGYAPSTIALARSVLKAGLFLAVEDGTLEKNPASFKSGTKRVQRPTPKVLSQIEGKVLLSFAKDTDLEALLFVALYTGLRQGEILGLHWEDIDLTAGVITVNANLVEQKGRILGRFAPKSKKPRKVSIRGPVLEALKSIRPDQNSPKGPYESVKAIVFPSISGGYQLKSSLHRKFKKILSAAGLPDTKFHSLRHTFASTLLKKGVSVKVVQELLGHFSPTLTLTTYAHVMSGMNEAAAETLAGEWQ